MQKFSGAKISTFSFPIFVTVTGASVSHVLPNKPVLMQPIYHNGFHVLLSTIYQHYGIRKRHWAMIIMPPTQFILVLQMIVHLKSYVFKSSSDVYKSAVTWGLLIKG